MRAAAEAVRLSPERGAGLPREEPSLLQGLPRVPAEAEQAA